MVAEAAVMKSSRSAVVKGVETNYSDQSVSGECIRVMVCSFAFFNFCSIHFSTMCIVCVSIVFVLYKFFF